MYMIVMLILCVKSVIYHLLRVKQIKGIMLLSCVYFYKVHKACADGWLLREMSFEIMTDPPEFLGCTDLDLQIRTTIMSLARKHLKLRVSKYCKRLSSHIGQEQACTRFTWLFVWLFVRHHAKNG